MIETDKSHQTVEPPTSEPEIDNGKKFGDMILRAREEAGYSLNRAALATKISPLFIEALETGNFGELPGIVFGRGFIRSLCKIYNREPNGFLAVFEKAQDNLNIRPNPTFYKGEFHVSTLISSKNSKRALLPQILKRYFPGYYFRSTPFFFFIAILFGGVYGTYYLVSHLRSNSRSIPQGDRIERSGNFVPTLARPYRSKREALNSNKPGSILPIPPLESLGSYKVPALKELRSVHRKAEAKGRAQQISSRDKKDDLIVMGTGDQSLEIRVVTPTTIRVAIDGGGFRDKPLEIARYRYLFNQKVDLVIFDAAGVKILFNNRYLGPLGAKGEVKRLSFVKEDG